MRRCIVHIGIHKTGSTAIQRTLGLNRANLERTGILFPEVPGKEGLPRGHHGLAAALNPDSKGEQSNFDLPYLTRTLRATEAEFVVLSSENLSRPGISAERIAELTAAIARCAFEVTVVAFVRPQAGLLNSTYLQRVQTFHFDASFDDHLTHVIDAPLYRIDGRLAGWTAQSNVRFVAVPYTGEVIGPQIAETLLAAGGVPRHQISAAGLGPSENANISIGAVAVAAFRAVRRLHPEISANPKRARIQAHAMALAQERGWMEEKFVGFDQGGANMVRDKFADGNEVFAARYMERSWHETFAAEYAKTWIRNEIDPGGISPTLNAEFRDFAHQVAAYSPEAEARTHALAR